VLANYRLQNRQWADTSYYTFESIPREIKIVSQVWHVLGASVARETIFHFWSVCNLDGLLA
jgi:hypothetical protein